MNHFDQWFYTGKFEIFWIKLIINVSIVLDFLDYMTLWLPKEPIELLICVRQKFIIIHKETIVFLPAWFALCLLIIAIDDA